MTNNVSLPPGFEPPTMDAGTTESAFPTAPEATYRVTADELCQFIERIERIDAEKNDLADQRKEVMAEAKARGYDTKVLRAIITLRRTDADTRAEFDAVLEMYKEAVGLE